MKKSNAMPAFEDSALVMLVAAARRALKHAVDPLLDPLDLTAQQGWILLLLRETGPLSLTELAKLMWLDHPTTSRLVHGLEARKVLEVKQDPTHGRRIQIGIAPEGRSLTETLHMAGETFRERVEKGFSQDEKIAFRGFLCRLLQNLSDMEAASKPKGRTKAAE